MHPVRSSRLIEPLESRIAPAAAAIPLSALDGKLGFKIVGEAPSDQFGRAVSDAGDVNGDGYGDLIIGAYGSDLNGGNSGAAYVVFGRPEGFPADFSVSGLNGSNGFRITGVAAIDFAGISVSAAGDVNGDGFGDLIVGANGADPGNLSNAGASYVIFGKASGFAASLNLASLNGTNGFKISGEATEDSSGRSVSAAGDVNGDGFADLIVGAPNNFPTSPKPGAAYVIFGKAGAFAANINLSAIDGTNGFKLTGVSSGGRAGTSVSGAGDVNGDGFDDLIIGAQSAYTNGFATGAAYVVFGKAGGFGTNLNLATLDGLNGFTLNGGAAGDLAGRSVSGAGDVNGDGFDDLLVGAPYADPNGSSSGASYVVLGKANGFAASLNLPGLDGSNGFKLNGVAAGDQSGRSVSGAGDLNGDGFDDVIIGAWRAGPNGALSGASYVVFGRSGGFAPNVELASLNGDNGVRVDGVLAGDFSGFAVSGAGDLNRDGFADLIIGAGRSLSGTDPGLSYVLYGNAKGFLPTISVSDVTVVEPVTGHVMAVFNVSLYAPATLPVSVQYSTADGTAVSPGDYSAAALTTLTFAPGETSKTVVIPVHADAVRESPESFFLNLVDATNATISDGQAVGTIFDKVAVLDLTDLDGSNGFEIVGVAGGSYAGVSVSDAGDINGDGFDDFIVGASGADTNGFDAGASYVIFGKPGGFPSKLNLSFLDGTNGFKISGIARYDASGASVSAAGDVNGDGFDDLVIGAQWANRYTTDSGSCYVVFGKASGFTADLSLSTLNGTNGFRIDGALGERAGNSVSGAGDFNDDGFDDLIIGAASATPDIYSFSGASYVVFGGPTFKSIFNVTSLDGSNGFRLKGVAARDYAGTSVSSAGDVNGDGFSDVIIGARGADPNGANSGASYVVFGRASGMPADMSLSGLNGSNGFKISGAAADDRAGRAVRAAGDINLDGFDDVIIGAEGADPNGSDSGAAYVVFGKAAGFAANLNLSTLNGANGFKLSGALAGDIAGVSVSGAGDFNGDGCPDLIVGAVGADPNGAGSGASYVVFGTKSGFAANMSLSSLNGANGFVLKGPASALAGRSVSGAGDVNGDGFDDLLIGTAFDFVGSPLGSSYVVFGRGVEISVGNAVVSEGDAGTKTLQFTVSLSEAGTVPVTVQFGTVNGTAMAGQDFEALTSASLTFNPGETSRTVTLNVLGDALFENDETLSLMLSSASGGVIRSGVGTGTILNDDAAPVLSINGASSVLEGDTGLSSMVFTVSLSAASGLPVSVLPASIDGTAIAGVDYSALPPGALTFAPGETSKSIVVEIIGNTRIEDHKEFSIVLSGVVGATLGTGTGTGTILNDDTAVRVTGTGSILEGDGGRSTSVFHVTLEKASAVPVTVSYATLAESALSGDDFISLSGTLTFAPGEIEKSLSIEVVGDTSVEVHESFSILLSSPINATIDPAKGSASVLVLNDDAALSISDAQVLEGHSGSRTIVFTVSLSAESALPVDVSFTSLDGSATRGIDYTALPSGSLSFAPGETQKTLTIEVLGDTEAEVSESFSVILSSPGNAIITRDTGTGTILDDDVTLAGKRKATFRDVDGELATITVSKGTLKVEQFTLFPSGVGSQLAIVDFSGRSEFAGAALVVAAKKTIGDAGSNGLVDVGFLNAPGVNLGKIKIKGDLGRIDAGSVIGSKPAVLGLSVGSLGARGLETQLPDAGSTTSELIGSLRKLSISGDLQDATLSASGDIGAIAIKGSVSAAFIHSDGRIGAVKVGGDFGGNPSAGADSIISARGITVPNSAEAALAIASVSIKGNISHAMILAGYDRAGAGVNADVRVGPVSVGGDWSGSSLTAGAAAGPDGYYGTDDDVLIPSGNSVVAKIASILIKGSVLGSEATAGDSFGFVAEEIGKFSSGGVRLSLAKGKSNDLAGLAVDQSTDVWVREIPAAES